MNSSMDRRRFLQNLAATAALTEPVPALEAASPQAANLDGYTQLAEFEGWRVFEDLRTRDGALVFTGPQGARRVLSKSAEPCFATADPPYLGLKMEDIGMAGRDLLAENLLEHGDPDPERVRDAAPPVGSRQPTQPGARLSWNTFVGTKECDDTMPVFPAGNTRTYHPNQYFPELTNGLAGKRLEGMLGGWMPAVRKIFPLDDGAYIEAIVFGDVDAHGRFIVQTWHRTARIENGKIAKAVYGYSYPAYPPRREDPKPEAFYRALLRFAEYWEKLLASFVPIAGLHTSYIDMAKHAFAKELMVRPGGVYPKYGAVDRDYYGSEYDGFQDIFTMSAYANLECGRFDEARAIIDNYYSEFVNAKGMIDMRGPETAQFGLTLSLLAKYQHYTGDHALLAKHRVKVEATAGLLLDMQDESLKLSKDSPGYGLIHGWSESDACLAAQPATWWQPYYANSAFAARGLRDIAANWTAVDRAKAAEWQRRSKTLEEATVASVRANVRRDMDPPYVPLMPGSKLTFRESMATERPSPQQWPHRPYTELLHADILPEDLANLTIDTMRSYGATTLGVVANVGRPNPQGRAILGFISYGYALALLRLDRIEEFLLFLYSHRFHDHTPGSWTAGEVSGIGGGTATFCIPAQQTIPLLVRWMYAVEDSDADRLYLAKGMPREWVGSGETLSIDRAPTRWGRVSFRMQADIPAKKITASVTLARPGAPKELHVKFRLPERYKLGAVTANGRPVKVGGPHGDTAIVLTATEAKFELTAAIV
jgi:hypothetical protein